MKHRDVPHNNYPLRVAHALERIATILEKREQELELVEEQNSNLRLRIATIRSLLREAEGGIPDIARIREIVGDK